MSTKNARIEFLKSSFGNYKGDVVTVVMETDGEVYYYDGFHRWCFLYKEQDKDCFRYIPAGERLNKKK